MIVLRFFAAATLALLATPLEWSAHKLLDLALYILPKGPPHE